MATLRRATPLDHDAIWTIFHAVVAPGDTYSFDPAIDRDEALAYWFAPANDVPLARRRLTRSR